MRGGPRSAAAGSAAESSDAALSELAPAASGHSTRPRVAATRRQTPRAHKCGSSDTVRVAGQGTGKSRGGESWAYRCRVYRCQGLQGCPQRLRSRRPRRDGRGDSRRLVAWALHKGRGGGRAGREAHIGRRVGRARGAHRAEGGRGTWALGAGHLRVGGAPGRSRRPRGADLPPHHPRPARPIFNDPCGPYSMARAAHILAVRISRGGGEEGGRRGCGS